MTLLEIFKIEREVAENPLLPGLTVRRIPASNPDYIWLVLEWPQGRKTGSHEVREGKLRFIGLTGHKDPLIHLRMLQVARRMTFTSIQADAHQRDGCTLSLL
jgi:hypothetical protein